jgi:hypothetical protein
MLKAHNHPISGAIIKEAWGTPIGMSHALII